MKNGVMIDSARRTAGPRYSGALSLLLILHIGVATVSCILLYANDLMTAIKYDKIADEVTPPRLGFFKAHFTLLSVSLLCARYLSYGELLAAE